MMKLHTTNYFDTFITVAEDCPVASGTVPPQRSNQPPSLAHLQFEIIAQNPYRFTSDEVFFSVFAQRNDLIEAELAQAREVFFSKGQPCFRASPLTKKYGWGVHSNSQGKIAIYGVETQAYQDFSSDGKLTVVAAMRSKKK